MAHKTSLQNIGNPDIMTALQHTSEHLFQNQSGMHTLAQYDHNSLVNRQRQMEFYPSSPYQLSTGQQQALGAAWNYNASLSNMQMIYKNQQANRLHQVPPLVSQNQVTQNMPVVDRFHVQSSQFSERQGHVQSSLSSANGNLQHHFPQSYIQQNQQFLSLHNPQLVTPQQHSSAYMQRPQHHLKPTDLQRHNPAKIISDASVTQRTHQPPLGNTHSTQSTVCSFSQGSLVSSHAHIFHGGQAKNNLKSTSNNQSKSSTSDSPTSVAKVPSSQPSHNSAKANGPEGFQKPTSNMSYYPQDETNSEDSHLRHILSSGKRNQTVHYPYLDNSDVLPSTSTSTSSAENLVSSQNVHRRIKNPSSALSQNRDENATYPSSLGSEPFVGHSANLGTSSNSVNSVIPLNKPSVAVSEGIGRSLEDRGNSWRQEHASVTKETFEDINPARWYKYPETLSFRSDLEAMQADLTSYNDITSHRTHNSKSSDAAGYLAPSSTKSQNGLNQTNPAGEIQTNVNICGKDVESRTHPVALNSESISKNARTEALAVTHVKQELVDNSLSCSTNIKSSETANDVGVNSLLITNDNIEVNLSVTSDINMNIASAEKDVSVNNSPVTKDVSIHNSLTEGISSNNSSVTRNVGFNKASVIIDVRDNSSSVIEDISIGSPSAAKDTFVKSSARKDCGISNLEDIVINNLPLAQCINVTNSLVTNASPPEITTNVQPSFEDVYDLIILPTTNVCNQTLVDGPFKQQVSSTDTNRSITHNIHYSSHCSDIPAVNVSQIDKTFKNSTTLVTAVVETSESETRATEGSKKVKDGILSKSKVTDMSSVSLLPVSTQDRTDTASGDVIPADKETNISTKKLVTVGNDTIESICPQPNLNISAKQQPFEIARKKGGCIVSSNLSSEMPTKTINMNAIDIAKTPQHSDTSLSKPRSKTCADTADMTATDSTFMKTGIPDDQKLPDKNSILRNPAAVQSRRHTSPLPIKLFESENKTHKSPAQKMPTLRRSSDTQTIYHQSLDQLQGVEVSISGQKQALSIHNLSVPRQVSTQIESKQTGSGPSEQKVLSAREKVFNTWKNGHVVEKNLVRGRGQGSRISALGITKHKNNSHNLKTQTLNDPVFKETSENKVLETLASISHNDTIEDVVLAAPEAFEIKKSNEPKKSADIFYVMFHGHKLICFKLGTEALFLLYQFQCECFPGVRLDIVNYCINDPVFGIKRQSLNHPDKKRIVMFLKKNYRMEKVPLTIIHVNDARRIYHHFFGIESCTNTTCVIELPNDAVELDVVDSPSSRTLTKEIMLSVEKGEKSSEYKSPDETSNASTNVEQIVTESLSDQPINLHLNKTASSPNHETDYQVVHGMGKDDDDNDVTILPDFEYTRFISWSPGTLKTGGLCNTLIGQVRSYSHANENFLVVEDLCRHFGDIAFYKNLKEENITLYSCCQEVAHFLNSISSKFPCLKSLHDSLVKVADVGIQVTDGQALLKRSLIKTEDINEGESSPKRARIDDEVAQLPQEYRALLDEVDRLRRCLALSEAAREDAEAAREKAIKLSEYYEGVIFDITSTFKSGDGESLPSKS